MESRAPAPTKTPLAQLSIRSFFEARSPIEPTKTTSSEIQNNGSNQVSADSTNSRLEESEYQLSETTTSVIIPATSLPSPASISLIQDKHIQSLRRIYSLLLPVAYPDKFYQTILDPRRSPNFSRVALWDDLANHATTTAAAAAPEPASFGRGAGGVQGGMERGGGAGGGSVVGGIVCRLDHDAELGASAIYIQSLALLAPYRRHGLATALLESVIGAAVINAMGVPSTAAAPPPPSPHHHRLHRPRLSLYAHVWTDNADGLRWYEKRGFAREGAVVEGYYRRLKPDSAWVLRREIVASDYLRHAPQTPTPPTTASRAPPSRPAVSIPPSAATPPPPPPPPSSSSLRPPPGPLAASRATSYQKARPATEWNDLPDDILVRSGASTPSSSKPTTPSLPNPPRGPLSASGEAAAAAPGSNVSSRSSSRSATGPRKKKDRAYPAAAYGGS